MQKLEGALGVILPGNAGIPAQAALDLNRRKRRKFEQKVAKITKGDAKNWRERWA
jgi:hypothetical protein